MAPLQHRSLLKGEKALRSEALNVECHSFELDFTQFHLIYGCTETQTHRIKSKNPNQAAISRLERFTHVELVFLKALPPILLLDLKKENALSTLENP